MLIVITLANLYDAETFCIPLLQTDENSIKNLQDTWPSGKGRTMYNDQLFAYYPLI